VLTSREGVRTNAATSPAREKMNRSENQNNQEWADGGALPLLSLAAINDVAASAIRIFCTVLASVP
jgi:hypothetical protein